MLVNSLKEVGLLKMNNIYIDRSCSTQGYIRAIINAMENSLNRMQHYNDTNDINFLEQSQEWLDVTNIYMKELEHNYEKVST